MEKRRNLSAVLFTARGFGDKGEDFHVKEKVKESFVSIRMYKLYFQL